jgi:hypothetical protein
MKASMPPIPAVDPANLTLGQIVSGLRLAQLVTVCGIAVGVISASFSAGLKFKTLLRQTSPRQNWLVIHHIEGPDGQFVRAVAIINGIPYAYPADVPYTQIGQSMSDQRLPLPSADSYTVSFKAQLKNVSPASLVEASSRDTPIFRANALPTQQQSYRVNILNDQGLKLAQFLTVTYSFEQTE